MVASYLEMGKIVACLSALLLIVRADATIYEDALYDTGSKAYYKFHNQPATWLDAYTTCVEEGGQLAVVTGENKEFLPSSFHFSGFRIFLGFDNWETRSWSTIHGQSLKAAGYENWEDGEPNNDRVQRCGTMYKNGKFDDYYCSEKLPFICQINSFPEEYTYYADTKSYYRFHVKPATWLAAHTTCVNEGGHLAVISSQDEANYFVQNFPSNADSVFLGINSWERNGSWVTVHGRSLSEAGYEQWAPGEPNNGGGIIEQQCGTMYRTGKLNDDQCDRKLPYICEKKITEAETNINEVTRTTEESATNTAEETETSMTEETATSTTEETATSTTEETTDTTLPTLSTNNQYDETTTENGVDQLYLGINAQHPSEREIGGSANKEDSGRLKVSEGLKVETSESSSPQEVHFALSLVPLLRARKPLARLDAEIAILNYFRQRTA